MNTLHIVQEFGPIHASASNDTARRFTSMSALLVCVVASMSGCVINGGGGDGYDDTYEDRYEDRYEEEVYVDERSDETEEVFEEEVVEETEETTTTTTTTTDDPEPMIEEITCSAEDQGFADALPAEVFVIDPPAGCEWSETSAELEPELGLGFADIMNDEEYINLFNCGDAIAGSDVDWESEVAIYLSGWVPADSEPTFEWAVTPESGEVVLGLVSTEICTDELEFYQTMFIAPRREAAPRVISCALPSDC